MNKVRVVCISDTHTMHNQIQVPDGDIIVHAGDATFRGYQHEVEDFGEWYRNLPHTHKVFAAGNHDTSFEHQPLLAKQWLDASVEYDDNGMRSETQVPGAIIYLQDSFVEVEVNSIKLKIYGSPWQPEFCNWAFNLPRGDALKEKWDMIPKDTDILITHGPPYKNCDVLSELGSEPGRHIGCRKLRQALYRVQPKIHVCGHIHEGYGVEKLKNTFVVNASVNTCHYKPWNDPIIMDIYEDGTTEHVTK